MTSKVTKAVFKSEFEGQYGKLYSFFVTFDNGDEGFYNSKFRDQTKFVEGKEANYTKEELTGKKGTKYFKIKPADFEAKKGWVAEPVEQKFAGMAMGYATQLCCAGKIPIDSLGGKFTLIFGMMLNAAKANNSGPEQISKVPVEPPRNAKVDAPEPDDDLPF